MLYSLLGCFLAGIAVGAYGAYEISQGEIGRQNVIIVEQRAALSRVESESKAALTLEKLKVQKAEQASLVLKNNLDTNYAQQISTINAYVDRVRGLRKPAGDSSARSSDPVSEGGCAGVLEETSTDFTRAAYELELSAKLCREFVVDNNCGIQR